MRIHTALLIVALALGGALIAGASRPARAQETVTIAVGDFWFCSSEFQGGECLTTIRVGDTVVWDFSSASLPHTTTACTEFCNWDSGNMNGGTFSFTFDTQGGYLYRCSIHPTQMMGRIEVLPAEEEPTAEPTDDGGDGTPTATPGGGLPVVGQGPDSGSSMPWLLGALVAGAFGLSAMGAGAYAVARRRR